MDVCRRYRASWTLQNLLNLPDPDYHQLNDNLMFDYHCQVVSDACIVGHDHDAVRVSDGRCTGIFLDFMHGRNAESWVGSQTIFFNYGIIIFKVLRIIMIGYMNMELLREDTLTLM